MSEFLRLDGVKWKVTNYTNGKAVEPFCPEHLLPLRSGEFDEDEVDSVFCEEGHIFKFNRTVSREKAYVIDRIEAIPLKKLKTINLDDEAVPLTEVARNKIQETPYWIETRLVKSKVGKRLIIYAGNREKKDKTQIFVEPDIRRLSFDQKDYHPSDIFLKVEATFSDGVRTTIQQAEISKQAV